MRLSRAVLLSIGLLFAHSVAALAVEPRLRNSFGAFTFGLESRSPGEQIDLLAGLGYQGIVAGAIDVAPDEQTLKAYASHPRVRRGEFRVMGILWWAKSSDADFDAKWLAPVLVQAAAMKAPIWIIVEGKPSDEQQTLKLLRRVADQASPLGVEVVLYPHEGCAFTSAEDALALLKRLDRPAVKLSVHLCHEIKAGNEHRLPEVIDAVADKLALVSISGAEGPVQRKPGWNDTITPLDRGAIDLAAYTRALVRAGYEGPVILHTYGQRDPPEEHLARSIKRWLQISREIARDPTTLPGR